MNQSSFIEYRHSIQELSSKDSNQASTQTSKGILLDQLIKIRGEQFENQT